MKEAAGGCDVFSPVMWWHRLTPRQVKISASLGEKQETGLHSKAPVKTIQVALRTAMPQLSHPIQLSEPRGELSLSGAAWEKVGLQGVARKAVIWLSLIFFFFFWILWACSGTQPCTSKFQRVYLWPLPLFRHPITSFTFFNCQEAHIHQMQTLRISKPLSPFPSPIMSTPGGWACWC